MEWPYRCDCGYTNRRFGRIPDDIAFRDDGVAHFTLSAHCEECDERYVFIQALGALEYYAALGIMAEAKAKQVARKKAA